jgi:hypothetical protein
MRLPTDERIKRFTDGNDPQFAALYFQFARYLLISSSRPGGQPAGLQGLWNDSMTPPWDGKYTINIKAWPSGSVKGLRARGGFEVDVSWNNGRLRFADVRSRAGSPITLRYGAVTRELHLSKGKTFRWDGQ